MRKLLCEVKQLVEHLVVDHHWDVLFIEHDAVLVVVAVGRVLKIPRAAVDIERYRPQVLPRGMVLVACKAHIFGAELTLWIRSRGACASLGDVARILFGLGAVYCDVKHAVLGFAFPLHILCDSSGAPLISCTTNSSRKNKGLGVLKSRKRVPKPRPKKIPAKVNKTRSVGKSVRKRVYRIPDNRDATLHRDATLLELLYLDARYGNARSERFSAMFPRQRESIFTPEWLLLEKRRASERMIAELLKQTKATLEKAEREDSPRNGDLEKGNEEHEQ